MADEAPNRSARKTDSGDAQGGRGDEHSPLQARAAFIKNWSWESIIGLNRGSCERGRAQHGHNSETHERVRRQWEETRQERPPRGGRSAQRRAAPRCPPRFSLPLPPPPPVPLLQRQPFPRSPPAV